jgi:putative endonuclease
VHRHPGQSAQRQLYVGVTSDLVRRVWDHRTDADNGFTSQYGVKLLVFFEQHASMPDAIPRKSGSRNGAVPGRSN